MSRPELSSFLRQVIKTKHLNGQAAIPAEEAQRQEEEIVKAGLLKCGVLALKELAGYLPNQVLGTEAIDYELPLPHRPDRELSKAEEFYYDYGRYVVTFFELMPQYANQAEVAQSRINTERFNERYLQARQFWNEAFFKIEELLGEVWQLLLTKPLRFKDTQDLNKYAWSVKNWRDRYLQDYSSTHFPSDIFVAGDVPNDPIFLARDNEWDQHWKKLVRVIKLLTFCAQMVCQDEDQAKKLEVLQKSVNERQLELFRDIKRSTRTFPPSVREVMTESLNRSQQEVFGLQLGQGLWMFSNIMSELTNQSLRIHNLMSHRDVRLINFEGQTLLNRDFTGQLGEGTNFKNSQLSKTNFSQALLAGADFSVKIKSNQTEITEKRNEITDLDTDFSLADCRGANFSGRSFMCANFSKADLRDTRWDSVKFVDVNLEGANLSGAKISLRSYTSPREEPAIWVDHQTILPDGKACPLEGKYSVWKILGLESIGLDGSARIVTPPKPSP
jgi:uncharacterized protein YjbI with pentapeptide repeats